jgi:hypothetical protein
MSNAQSHSMPPISSEYVLNEASQRAGGANDFGGPEFLASLGRLVDSLNSEAQLNELGQLIASERMIGHALNRLLYIRDRKNNPEIADEKIVKPVFIVGMPRTGTTILHDILAQDPASRAPLTWELTFPSPPPEKVSFRTDSRIAQCEALFPDIDAQIPGFKAMHPMGAELTQECVMLMGDTLCSSLFHNQFRVPTFQDYIDGPEAPWKEVYQFHKEQLQHLQWRCKGDRWVLKTGAHLWSLEYLLEQYPDARIVFNHRDPVKSMTSYASLTRLVRTMSTDHVDPVEIASDWVPRLCKALHHSLDVRTQREYPQAKFYEMYFDDFSRDQFGQVEKVYEAFDIPMTDEAADRMRKFIAENPKGVHGEHVYREEDYGINPEEIREMFSRYIAHFDLRAE